MIDDLMIMQTVSRMGLAVDTRDWDGAVALFAELVQVDYTSLNGGEPESLTPEELVGGWRDNLTHLTATQHLIGSHVVTVAADRATCICNVQGTHVLTNARGGGPHWVVGGRYEVALVRGADGWLISALTLIVTWATGNQMIMSPPSATG